MRDTDTYLVFLAEEDVAYVKELFPKQRQFSAKCVALVGRLARLRSLNREQRSKISLTLVEPEEWNTGNGTSVQLRRTLLNSLPEHAGHWFSRLYALKSIHTMSYLVASHRKNAAAIPHRVR